MGCEERSIWLSINILVNGTCVSVSQDGAVSLVLSVVLDALSKPFGTNFNVVGKGSRPSERWT